MDEEYDLVEGILYLEGLAVHLAEHQEHKLDLLLRSGVHIPLSIRQDPQRTDGLKVTRLQIVLDPLNSG